MLPTTTMLAAFTIAADEAPNYASLGQYGALGIFAAILIWFAKWMIGRETARADRLEQEVLRLNATIQDKVIPALLSATGAVEESTELIRDLQRDARDSYAARRRPGLHENG